MNKLDTWRGEKSRQLRLSRPCKCGCDYRGGNTGAGYLTASDDHGDGFTLWIESEDDYQIIRGAIMSEIPCE